MTRRNPSVWQTDFPKAHEVANMKWRGQRRDVAESMTAP